jgi:hypothetical protein
MWNRGTVNASDPIISMNSTGFGGPVIYGLNFGSQIHRAQASRSGEQF